MLLFYYVCLFGSLSKCMCVFECILFYMNPRCFSRHYHSSIHSFYPVGLVQVSSGLMEGSGGLSLTEAQLHQCVDVHQTASPLLLLTLLQLLLLLMRDPLMFNSCEERLCCFMNMFVLQHLLPLRDELLRFIHVSSTGSQTQTSLLLRETQSHQLEHLIRVQTQLTEQLLHLTNTQMSQILHESEES